MSKYGDHAERWNYMQELLKEALPKKKAVDQKRKYIQRYDFPEKSAHYWQVRIRVRNETITKCFCDKKNGGKTSSMLAAVGWRNKMIAEYGLVFQKGLKKQPFDSGKKGVYKKTKTDRGYSYDYWVAYWHEPAANGKQIRKQKSFSMNKYGKIRSKQKAVKFRKDKLKELYG